MPNFLGATRGRTRCVALTAVITAGLLGWTHWLAATGPHGLSDIFYRLFTGQDSAGLWCELGIVAVAACVPSRAAAAPLLLWIGEHPRRVAVTTGVVLSCGAWFVYRHTPLAMDEYAAYFQSQVFAAGHLYGQFPPALIDWLIPKAFQDYFLHVTADGRVSSGYWPAFALLLTPFTWLGIPWVCNPLVSATTLLALHRLALRMFADRTAAGLTVLLTVASPVFFGEGISLYSMPAHLLANTLYALLLIAPTPRKAFAAGFIGSIALTLHNPVPHLLFAVPWIAHLGRRVQQWRSMLALLAGYLPLCLLLGVGWFLLTSATPTGGVHVPLPFAWPTTAVVLARAVGIAKLWVWAVPALLVLAVAGAWAWRHDATCRLLAASALLTLLGYFIVPVDQGHGWGYRYFHSTWLALPLLATAAVTRRPTLRRPALRRPTATCFADDSTRGFLVSCACLTLVVADSLRGFQIHDFIVQHQREVPAYSGTEPRIVILDTRSDFYGRDLVQNDPFLRNAEILLLTHAARADAAMMQANFPGLQRVYADAFGSVWSAAPTPPVAQPNP